jgi:hypothetical protein
MVCPKMTATLAICTVPHDSWLYCRPKSIRKDLLSGMPVQHAGNKVIKHGLAAIVNQQLDYWRPIL